MQHNGGGFDVALDLVGGTMLSACCELLALNGNLASMTEALGQDDFEAVFQTNASFPPVRANASSLTNDRAIWRNYREILDHLSQHFASGARAPPRKTILGGLSASLQAPMRCWKTMPCRVR